MPVVVPPQSLAWESANQILQMVPAIHKRMDNPPTLRSNATIGWATVSFVQTGTKAAVPPDVPQWLPWSITRTRVGFVARSTLTAKNCSYGPKCVRIKFGATYSGADSAKSSTLKITARRISK